MVIKVSEAAKKITPFLIPVALSVGFLLWKRTLPWYELLSGVCLLFWGGIAAWNDLKTKRVSNRLILALIGSWCLLFALRLALDGEHILLFLLGSIGGAMISGGLFLLVYLLSKKGLGGGDVKFMFAAGLLLGWRNVLPVTLIGSILSAIVCFILILLKKMQKTDAVPLIPFLYMSILLLHAAK